MVRDLVLYRVTPGTCAYILDKDISFYQILQLLLKVEEILKRRPNVRLVSAAVEKDHPQKKHLQTIPNMVKNIIMSCRDT